MRADRLAIAALTLVFLSCGTDGRVQAGRDALGNPTGPVAIQLIAFNDFHGNLAPPSGSNGRITLDAQGAVVEAGGAEFMATRIKALEAQNPNTLVVSAGDIIGATPLVSALFHDEPSIESVNLMGLDVASVGNHEFDEGLDELARMQHGGCHPVDGCQDGDGFTGAAFPYLAANVVREGKADPVLPGYAIKDIAGVRIGFIGLTLEGTPLVTTRAGVEGLRFLDEAQTINALVPELREQGVRAIVVLLHEGGATTGLYNACDGISGALFEIAAALDPEIDVVVAGHTNQAHVCDIGGKLVTSAASFGRLLTDIDLTIDPVSGDVVSKSATNVIVDRTLPRDPDQSRLLARYGSLAAPLANRIVAQIATDLTKAQDPSGQSTLGNTIADALLGATRGPGTGQAQIAFANHGGIRAELIASQTSGGEGPGQVTYGEAFAVQPFSNVLSTLTLTGAQLDALLEQQWQRVNGAEKAQMLGVSSGFSYVWDPRAPLGERVDAARIRLNGAAIDPAASYRVTVISYLAEGGDGLTVLRDGTDRVAGPLDVDAFTTWLGEKSPLSPPALDRVIRQASAR